jgi:hypothetical protein
MAVVIGRLAVCGSMPLLPFFMTPCNIFSVHLQRAVRRQEPVFSPRRVGEGVFGRILADLRRRE